LFSLKTALEALGDEVFLAAGTSALGGFLERNLIDACHVHFFSRGLEGLSRLKIPPSTRLVVTHQGASVAFVDHRKVLRALVARADRVTAVSRDGALDLRRRFPSAARKVAVIPNGADRLTARGKRAFPGPFILTVGRVAAYKGSDLLLMAFAAVSERRPGLKLVVCGPDQTGGRARLFAEKLGLRGKVSFLGAVGPARVAKLVRDCLFFTLPSRHENMPMALLEAMAAGKASLASRVGGVPDLVSHGVDGWLIGSDDAAALERGLLRLATDAPLRTRLGKRAALKAKAYTWTKVAARYRRLYNRGA
jgi:glycosyltransferase involved in cell wall biosynthesis